MRTLTEQELRSKIERNKEKIDLTFEHWDETPQERKPYFRLGMDARSVGIYTLLLQNYEEGTKWLKESAGRYLRAREKQRNQTNEPQMMLWSLLTAVLSKDENTMQAVVDSGPVEHTDPEYFTQFDNCLAALIRGGDNGTVLDAAQYLDQHEQAAYETDYYDGLGTICRGIAERNEKSLDDGLNTILERHQELVPKLGETMDDALVCVPATALLLLAEERRMDVLNLDIYDNEYIPWDYIERD